MPGASWALNHKASAFAVPGSRTSQQCLGLMRRHRLLDRDLVRVRRPQAARLGPPVTRGQVAERSRVQDLVDRRVDQLIEPEAVRIWPQEIHHVGEVAVVHQRRPRRHRVGNHGSARFEPAVARGYDGNEHPLVDPEPAEPLRDDHIDTFRRLDLQDVALNDLDYVRNTVRGGQLLSEDRDGRLFHCVDACGARPRREQAEDSAARPDVENDVAGTHDRLDRLPECLCANAVADHRPVYFEFRVHRIRWMFDRRTHSQTVNDPPMAHLADGPLAAPAAATPAHCFIGQPQNATRCHATSSSSPPTDRCQ